MKRSARVEARRSARNEKRKPTLVTVDAKFIDERTPKPLQPKTPAQADYLDALKTYSQVVAIGSAGTGKSYIPACYAADQFRARKVGKIILTRPNVPASRTIGLLPGTLEEKFGAWLTPITETIKARMGAGAYEIALKHGDIEMVPLEYIRGRSFSDAIVICDEAQNLTVHEARMLLTRIGEDCLLILNGDTTQVDHRETPGLAKIVDMVDRYSLPVSVIRFTEDDIVRSDVCAAWVKAFNREI